MLLRSWTYSPTITLKIKKQDVCISLSKFKESGVVYTSLSFWCCVVTTLKRRVTFFQRRNWPKQGKKQSIRVKTFYWNTFYVLHIKNCISKLSIKRFIKRKTRAGKAYAYQMLLSFKTSVTYNDIFDFMPDNCARCEVAFVGHNFLPEIVWCLLLIFRGAPNIKHLY